VAILPSELVEMNPVAEVAHAVRRLRSSLLELIFSLAGGCAFVVRVTLQ